MKTTGSVLMLLMAVMAISACEKNAVLEIADPPSGGTSVKFFNFSVGSPAVNFYVNDDKVTAVSAVGCFLLDDTNRDECLSSGREATTGVAYGSAGNGVSGWYSDVAPGQVTISGRIAAATDKNLPISNYAATIEAGKFYSYYLSGIYNATTKQSESFIVEDVLPPADFSVAYVRFVNASATTQPMTLYATDRATQVQTAVGGLVAYQSAGGFVALPEATYDLATRTDGSTTNVFTRTAVTFTAGRVYTIAARGNTATASTMALDNTANR
ncbi:MAG TPA: DUF4397 domain-containing protein [Longimicrobiales bacterium]